jgi:hypothetical protein
MKSWRMKWVGHVTQTERGEIPAEHFVNRSWRRYEVVLATIYLKKLDIVVLIGFIWVRTGPTDRLLCNGS